MTSSQTKKPKTSVKKKTASQASRFKKTTKKMVDQMLLRVSPAVEKQMDQLSQALEKAPTSIDDFKMLGYKVLQRARVISSSLRKEAAQRKAEKIGRKKSTKKVQP